MSKTHELKPWTKVAVPHDDILLGDFDLSSYAANLGQADVLAERCPAVYKDPVAFFRATYRTSALDDLLGGVADVLGGGAGNRVLQLRTPFGGGKTHTLIALLHLFRNRDALDRENLVPDFGNPGQTRVVPLPFLDFDAAEGREVDGLRIRTAWGEMAYRLGGPKAFALVKEADSRRVNPGGEVLRKLLDGEPTLLLLDEVLTYVEAALGIAVGDTTLGRQTMLFLQYLTEVVRGLPKAAMVYSLQQSVREAMGDEGLLDMLDSLVSRVDAKREPVTGDEVLKVVQRRLFKDLGDEEVHRAVADEYASRLESYLRQGAHTDGEKRAAADQAGHLRRRILDAYPFHPELLDLMYHRWGSLPTYQRTRGALQFLATVIGAQWKQGDGVGALIGPGDVPITDPHVRNTFFSQVGEREALKSVLDSDLVGTAARCRRVDDAIAADAPGYQVYRPGTRLTRALALYSFGAKPGEDRGVIKSDLLRAVQAPGLPGDVLEVALQGLSDTLLYIHSTGRRYRFEKKPNLNKLVDDEAKKFEQNEVLTHVRDEFKKTLGSRTGFAVWPNDSAALLDKKPQLQIAFLGPEHALGTPEEMVKLARGWTERCGQNKRGYKNAVAFAFPAAEALNTVRKAARRLMAVGSLLEDKKRHGFSEDDVEDLRGRRKRASVDFEAGLRQLYPTVLLPVAAPPSEQDPIRMERFEIQGYQAAGAGLVENVLRVLENWVFDRVVPTKLAACVHLGEGDALSPSHWIDGPKLVEEFFSSVQYPKLRDLAALKRTVAEGVAKGQLGYVMGAAPGEKKLDLRTPDSLSFKRTIPLEDVDLTEGSFVISPVLARALVAELYAKSLEGDEPGTVETDDDEARDPGTAGGTGEGGSTGDEERGTQPPWPPEPPREVEKEVRLQFRANSAKQLYAAYNALQVLSEWADESFVAQVQIHAVGKEPIDRNQYETSVLMSLEEEDIDVAEISDGEDC